MIDFPCRWPSPSDGHAGKVQRRIPEISRAE